MIEPCPACSKPLDDHTDEQAKDCAYAYGYSEGDYGWN